MGSEEERKQTLGSAGGADSAHGTASGDGAKGASGPDLDDVVHINPG